VLGSFFNLKGTPSWILPTNVLMPVEPNLLVMCERIGEALNIVHDVLDTFQH
jgi:hypothetical protein